jgi:hypothetical protein
MKERERNMNLNSEIERVLIDQGFDADYLQLTVTPVGIEVNTTDKSTIEAIVTTLFENVLFDCGVTVERFSGVATSCDPCKNTLTGHTAIYPDASIHFGVIDEWNIDELMDHDLPLDQTPTFAQKIGSYA